LRKARERKRTSVPSSSVIVAPVSVLEGRRIVAQADDRSVKDDHLGVLSLVGGGENGSVRVEGILRRDRLARNDVVEQHVLDSVDAQSGHCIEGIGLRRDGRAGERGCQIHERLVRGGEDGQSSVAISQHGNGRVRLGGQNGLGRLRQDVKVTLVAVEHAASDLEHLRERCIAVSCLRNRCSEQGPDSEGGCGSEGCGLRE